MNPFEYYKTPKTVEEAQSTINYWWYVSMGGEHTGNPQWFHYIRENMRLAKKQKKELTSQTR